MVNIKTKKLVLFAMLLTLIIVLQVFGSYFKVGTISLSFVLIPIVFGGMVLGVLYGTLLGLAFGIVTLVMGIVGADAFTNILFTAKPFMVILCCILKATAAGFVSSFLFKILKGKSILAATIVSALSAPIVNTSIFIAIMLMMTNTLAEEFAVTDAVYFLFIVCAGLNFLIELGLNILLAPSLYTAFNAISKRRNSSWGQDDSVLKNDTE